MKTLFTLTLALLGVAVAAQAHEFTAGKLEIGHPWTRATTAEVGVGYLTVKNSGKDADTLKGASFAGAESVMIHQSVVKDGMASMQMVHAGVVIPAGGEVKFAPGGYHLMLMGLKAPLKEGDMISGTLVFDKAGVVPVGFKVEKAGATVPAHEMMPGMKM